MKTFFWLLFLLVMFTVIYAAPLRNLVTEITQPDGSIFSCFATGDEYYHRIHDAQGYTIIQNPETGWFVYAVRQDRKLVPTIFIPGESDPQALGLVPNLMIDEAEILERVERFRGPDRNQYGRTTSTGIINNISIFVRFSDQSEYTDAISTYDNMFNSTTSASLKGFFLEESNSQLTVGTTFYPPDAGGIVTSYQDSNPRSYYSPYNAATNPTGYTTVDQGFCRLHVMLANAVIAVSGSIPPTLNVDHDMDGIVDNISFICQGPTDAWADVLWPHYWNLDYYYVNPIPSPPYTVPLVYINGSQVDDYNFELSGAPIDVAVVCHEFSHTMGFPDLYHYTWDGVDPCGWFDLMDYCQGTPQHHLAYMKWRYGNWFATMPTIPGPGVYTVNDIASSPFSCFWYSTGASEWYVFEYRKQTGIYESTVPGTGLVVYRVRPDISPYGNAGGPPDEVYVYRPGGTLTTNGNIYAAQYGMDLGHTVLNNYTNPTPFLSNGSPGPLIMHHVSTAGGSTISFEIGTTVPKIWTGASDSNWGNGSNWLPNTAPTIADYCIITGLNPPNWPMINPGAAENCAALRVEQNMFNTCQLLVNSTGILFCQNDCDVFGVVTLVSNMLVGGNLTMRSGGQFNGFPSPSTALQICGDCTFENGSIFNMNAGLVEFASAIPGGTEHIYNYSSTVNFFDVWLNKSPGTIYFNSASTQPILINGDLTVVGGTTCYMDMTPNIDLVGNLTVNPGCHLYGTNGELKCIGTSTPQIINFTTTNSYFNHFRICNVVQLNSTTHIHGDLYIDLPSGHLMPMANTIIISGDWWDMMGPPFFDHAGSRVIFNGATDQNINTLTPVLHAQFGILEIDKSSGALVINTSSQMVTCDAYDYTTGTLKVLDGVFAAASLLDNCIKGNFEVHSWAGLDLANPGGLVDLEGSISIFGGIVNILDGTADSQWPGPSGSGGGITMTSGHLNLDVGVVVGNAAFPLAENISGGTIRIWDGDLDVQRNDFNPSGGTIEFNGYNDVNIGMAPGSNFHNILIDKDTDTINVTLNTDIILNGDCEIVKGRLDVNGYELSVVGNTNIGSNGWLVLNDNSIIETGNNSWVNVNNGGTLYSHGVSGQEVTMRGQVGSFWQMKVYSGGYASVKHTDFENLTGSGVQVDTGATVDNSYPFDNCSFKDGANNSTLLTINNSQNLTIDGLSLPYNSGETYNVAKTVNLGSLNLTGWSGSFGGPAYENDPNGLIDWASAYPNLTITALGVSDNNPYVADQITYSIEISNDSPYAVAVPFHIHLFKNRSTAPGWTETGDNDITCPTMAGYATSIISIPDIYSMVDESWTSWILIDPEEAVTETDENDNRDSITVTWNPLPPVNITFDLTGASTGRISWTYPIWVDRFQVYYDSSPYGSFSGSLGSTTNLYMDIGLSPAMMFYMVTAERDEPTP